MKCWPEILNSLGMSVDETGMRRITFLSVTWRHPFFQRQISCQGWNVNLPPHKKRSRLDRFVNNKFLWLIYKTMQFYHFVRFLSRDLFFVEVPTIDLCNAKISPICVLTTTRTLIYRNILTMVNVEGGVYINFMSLWKTARHIKILKRSNSFKK